MAGRATDFPLWADCPFAALVPEQYTIRTGSRYGRKLVVFSEEVNGKSLRHVAACMDMNYDDPVTNISEANAAEWVPTLVELLAQRTAA